MVVYLKQDLSYLLYTFYSRYGEEMYMTVAMLEEVFHLSGCPLYAECLASSSVLHFSTSCASSSGMSQWKVLGTMVSCESLANGLMAGMIGIVIPICGLSPRSRRTSGCRRRAGLRHRMHRGLVSLSGAGGLAPSWVPPHASLGSMLLHSRISRQGA